MKYRPKILINDGNRLLMMAVDEHGVHSGVYTLAQKIDDHYVLSCMKAGLGPQTIFGVRELKAEKKLKGELEKKLQEIFEEYAEDKNRERYLLSHI